jgi:putative transposase
MSRGFEMPASVRVSVDGGAWFVSFSSGGAEEDAYPETAAEAAARLAMEFEGREAEFAAKCWGGDVGIAIPLAGSDGLVVDFSEVQKARMKKKGAKAKRYQKKLSRQQRQYALQKAAATKRGEKLRRVSGKQAKTILAMKKQAAYAGNVRDDVAHKATTKLAGDDRYVAYAMENLKIANMVRAPKPKPDPENPGGFLPNGAAAKAGLNKAIHSAMWGRFAGFLEYKARGKGKLFLRVDPKHTSQECSACGSVSPENRTSQALFCCQACGHSENADINAAKVVKKRMCRMVLDGLVAEAPKAKKVSARKGKIAAAESREGDPGGPPLPAEEQSPESQGSLAAPKKRESSCFRAR